MEIQIFNYILFSLLVFSSRNIHCYDKIFFHVLYILERQSSSLIIPFLYFMYFYNYILNIYWIDFNTVMYNSKLFSEVAIQFFNTITEKLMHACLKGG